ncbi:MAG: hypothetical protein MK226_00310 [Saprospiraceae bacterium]|nr:hypothetical protein [Saprospiraceae bacterium]
MKTLPFLVLTFLFCCPFLISAQSIVGSWSWDATTPDGKAAKNMLTFQKDGVYKVDLGMNGSYEIEGSYTLENDQITIVDTSEGPCKGVKGVYNMKIEDNQIVTTLVSDDCLPRKGNDPDTPMIMTRVQ